MRVLLTAVLFLVLAPTAFADEQADLDAAKGRWAAGGLTDYRFHVRRSCFCPPEYTREQTVDVIDGEAYRPPKPVEDIATVPRLFALIQKGIDGDGTITVTYADSGLPTAISADPVPMAVDDEYGVTAGGLEKTDGTPPRPVAAGIEDGSAAKALAEARATWKRSGLKRYRYRLLRLCFCAARKPRTVTVRDGREPPLFKVVARAIRERYSGLTVRYGRTGFPRVVQLDPDGRIADEEQTFQASRLRRLR